MVHIYSGSNTTSAIGKVMDYNNTNPSRGVSLYRILRTSGNPLTLTPSENSVRNDFANAIYGNGPYSLLHPNATTNSVALNVDYIA